MTVSWNPQGYRYEPTHRDQDINNGYETVDRISMKELFIENESIRIKNSRPVCPKKKAVHLKVLEHRAGNNARLKK